MKIDGNFLMSIFMNAHQFCCVMLNCSVFLTSSLKYPIHLDWRLRKMIWKIINGMIWIQLSFGKMHFQAIERDSICFGKDEKSVEL